MHRDNVRFVERTEREQHVVRLGLPLDVRITHTEMLTQ